MVDYASRLQKAIDDMPGMTASLLASKMGVTYQGVKKVLDGRSKAFSAENNTKAARALKVNSDWLATGRGERSVDADQVASPASTQRGAPTAWPFTLASRARLEALLGRLPPKQAREALADMDRQLHRVLSDWERQPPTASGHSLTEHLLSFPATVESPRLPKTTPHK